MENCECKERASQNVASTTMAARTNSISGSIRSSGGDHHASSHCSFWTNIVCGSGSGNNRDRGIRNHHDCGHDWYGRDCHHSNYHRNNWDNGRCYDEQHGKGRDDHRSHHSSHNGNGNRCGGHGGHDHHISEERSRSNYCGHLPSFRKIHGKSPSHSCFCISILRKICSRSASRAVDTYHIAGLDA